jgi:hypothetical protein
MRTDGQTDLTKLIIAFRNFAKAPEKEKCRTMKTKNQKRMKCEHSTRE